MKITYEGMRATRKHLIVYGVLETAGAARFVELPIPLASIDAGAVGQAMDTKVRLDLLSIWSAERGDEAMF